MTKENATIAAPERRTERMGMAVTPTEKEAFAKLAAMWPEKYEGASSALRDFTPAQAVAEVQRLTAALEVQP